MIQNVLHDLERIYTVVEMLIIHPPSIFLVVDLQSIKLCLNLIKNDTDANNHEIHTIDGQNQTQILQYKQLNNTNQLNPCIPMTVKSKKSIIITFATGEWKEWHHLNLCDYQNNTYYYDNAYLFDGGKSFTFNNQIMHAYSIEADKSYPIIRSMNNQNALMNINHGSFTNISSFISKPLFSSASSIYVKNYSFVKVQLFDVMFYAYHTLEADIL